MHEYFLEIWLRFILPRQHKNHTLLTHHKLLEFLYEGVVCRHGAAVVTRAQQEQLLSLDEIHSKTGDEPLNLCFNVLFSKGTKQEIINMMLHTVFNILIRI